jgi:hypothetical protein
MNLLTTCILDNETSMILNYDRSVSAVVHQFDRRSELADVFGQRTQHFVGLLHKNNDAVDIRIK